ncbi:Cathepsin_L [Hexamita inflata]|uniref:Cathepsin L n=1 Tax=Hexamita inflata TaxID=28002 RepID=A0AA86P9E7_9EUKA|nr:Cathepsin L [Hexamita inflata]
MDRLSVYDGSTVINIYCDIKNQPLDHQVTIIGYGRKNGQEVWILKNSWGPNWARNGHLFVPIGANSLCTEQYAVTIIPLTYDLLSNDKYYISKQQRGGEFDLDPDQGDKKGMQSWLLAVVIIVPIVVIIGVAIGIFFCCRRNKSQVQAKITKPIFGQQVAYI